MKAARVRVLSCPSCGGALPGAASPAFVRCPSCGASLHVRVEGAAPRSVLPPVVDRDRAVAVARSCWEGEYVPAGFLLAGRVEPPQLVWAAFHEIERTLVHEGPQRRVVLETLDRRPAVDLPETRLEGIDLSDRAARVAFDPVRLGREGIVLDPSRDPHDVSPVDPEARLIEERVETVYAPVWVVRCRFGRNLYEAAVDARSEAVLRARAPAERDARLPQAIAAIYLLALVAAFLTTRGTLLLWAALRMGEAGLAGGLFVLAALAWIAAWSWDRIRFRYEVVVEGDSRRLQAINRPERTAPEKVRDALFSAAGKLLESASRRRR